MATYDITLSQVKKRFGHVEALRGVDLRVPRGSVFALIGPNGAGKTTLFGVCCGFLQADSGSTEILGGIADPSRLKGRLAALPQDAFLGREITVREHLFFLARLQGLDDATAGREVDRVLELVDLGDLGERRAGSLSHGQSKRVGVAQAFLGHPELILLDEPTAGLDPRHAHDLRDAIRRQGGQRTLVVSSHNLQELEAICDEAAFIEKGLTLESGQVASLTARDAEVQILLAPGPEPVEAVRREVEGVQADFLTDRRILRVRFAPRQDRVAEDVIGEVLRVLLAQGARISQLSRGRSLEQRYLETAAPEPGGTPRA
jgi:ABC-type multidrug transport system ATPase subunit